MAPIVFPVSSAPGQAGQEGSGRLINCRAVKTEQGAHAPFKWPRTAGLREKLSDVTLHTHCRGLILVGSTLLHVLGSRVYAVTESGSALTGSNLGALSGTDTATLAKNNAATPDIVAVCAAGTFNLFIGSAPTSFADGDLPAVNSCFSAAGYIGFTTASGQLWFTELNAVTVSSSGFVESQLEGGLLRGVLFRGEVFAMGPNGIRTYRQTGASPVPFEWNQVQIPIGIIGTHAVAGWEPGWIGQLLWVAPDTTVRRLNGNSADIVSNEDVSRAIASATDRSAIQACVYMDGPNAIFSITSPGEWTWELNVNNSSWSERESYQQDDWRARCTVKAFDMWLAGDDETGKLASIDQTYRFEYGSPLVWQIDSGSNAVFPNPISVGPAQFWFNAALGNAAGEDPIETDPAVLISWSLDGGYSYGNPVSRALGAQGVSRRVVGISTVGLAGPRGVRFRLQISDPVEPGFQGGEMPAVVKRAA